MVTKSQVNYLESLFLKHSAPMAYAAFRRIGDWQTAEDIVQETYLIASCKADIVCQHEKPVAWLYDTLNKLVKRELQMARRRDVFLDNMDIIDEKSMDLPMELYLPCDLSEADRKLILLRLDQGLSFEELAAQAGTSEVACRKRFSRAIQRCRESMLRQEDALT